MPLTLLDKIWESHTVAPETRNAPAVLYVDLHMLHEVSSPQAFATLDELGLAVHRPDRTLATLDHAVPTLPAPPGGKRPFVSEDARLQVSELQRQCKKHGIRLHDWDSPYRGIVHVMGPELGATWPGMTVVCGDSHTTTHGAFGALAFGIGTSEVAHVLATQCVLQRKPKSMLIEIDGALRPGIGAKDLILYIIREIGVKGARGHVLEFTGDTIRDMPMEGRMTLCNMSIECGAKAGLIAPDEVTFRYLKDRPMAPGPAEWDRRLEQWSRLASDQGAQFDRRIRFDAGGIGPQMTYGTNPGMTVTIGESLPAWEGDQTRGRAMQYMGWKSGDKLLGRAVDIVFIGSCTNARLSDLREAARVLRGRKVCPSTRVIIVPGSQQVKRKAESEGLDRIFLDAGAEWREPGCSMCIAMNGDIAEPGQVVVSTSNRNFEGRQGKGARTLLASPLTAAVCAATGKVTEPLAFMEQELGQQQAQ